MPKVKVTAKFQILELIDRFIDGTTANSIGNAVVDEARNLIASGISPVRGHGRFERYKDRTKYPGNRKSVRPVNLYLSGDMLDTGFGFRRTERDSIEVGMVKGSSHVKEIAGYHHDGTEKMAQRRFIPGDDEEWSVSIMRRIRDIYGERLAKLIRQSNKKG